MIRLSIVLALTPLIFSGAAPSRATSVPFTEEFATDNSDWLNARETGDVPAGFEATGRPDGGSFASGTFNFQGLTSESRSPVIFRAREIDFGGGVTLKASGGTFFGDWIQDGVKKLTLQVRHDAPTPLTFFTRFAGPNNFPGAVGVNFAPVFPNTWTDIEFAINRGNAQFLGFPESSFDAVFPDVGRLQVGVSLPQALLGVDRTVTFGIDKVSTVATPEPASAAMLAVALAGASCAAHPLRRTPRGGCAS